MPFAQDNYIFFFLLKEYNYNNSLEQQGLSIFYIKAVDHGRMDCLALRQSDALCRAIRLFFIVIFESSVI